MAFATKRTEASCVCVYNCVDGVQLECVVVRTLQVQLQGQLAAAGRLTDALLPTQAGRVPASACCRPAGVHTVTPYPRRHSH